MFRKHPVIWLIVILMNLIFFSSCVSTKKQYRQVLYFNNIKDSIEKLTPMQFEQRLQPGDILYISVATPNKEMLQILNQPITLSGTSSSSGGPLGYLVENDSTITFPVLGKLNVVGNTKNELTQTLVQKLKYVIDSPIVTVRLLNYRITMLGEVAKPGTIIIPNERVNILDAIGLAGDLTLYGIRDSVRVIRQNEGKIQTGTINLNSTELFSSPFFYLKQNDIVYVKMQRRKLVSADQASLRNISIGIGIISAIAVLANTIINLTNKD